MKFIGIDPGSCSGAVAVIEGAGIEIFRFKGKTDPQVAQFFRETLSTDCHIALEKVHSMPGQGVSSVFKFGQNFGLIKGCLYTATIGRIDDVSIVEVSPQRWMKFLGTRGDRTKSEWKHYLKQVAEKTFPRIKLQDADAVLLALYAKELANA